MPRLGRASRLSNSRMSDIDDIQPMVLDMGSDLIKFGFGGNDYPNVVIPNIVSKLDSVNNAMIGLCAKQHYRADEALANKCGIKVLERPVVNGMIRDINLMESMWHHTFYNEIHLAPEENVFLFTEQPHNPICDRKDMIQIAMETFNIPAVYFAIPGVLNYYATKKKTEIAGNKSGVFVECGSGVTSVVPVYRGEVLTQAIMRQNWAGDVCTDRLSQLLQERGLASSVSLREEVERIKLGTALVSVEPNPSNDELGTKIWENPDGEKFDVNRERFECMEPIFSPAILDSDALGIHRLALASIERCEESIQRELCNRIVLSGGTTVCPGFEVRFKREMDNILSSELKEVLTVIALPERKYSTWIGGSLFSCEPLYEDLWITKKDYDEHGPDIVDSKCRI